MKHYSNVENLRTCALLTMAHTPGVVASMALIWSGYSVAWFMFVRCLGPIIGVLVGAYRLNHGHNTKVWYNSINAAMTLCEYSLYALMVYQIGLHYARMTIVDWLVLVLGAYCAYFQVKLPRTWDTGPNLVFCLYYFGRRYSETAFYVSMLLK